MDFMEQCSNGVKMHNQMYLVYWGQIQHNHFGKIKESNIKTGFDFIDNIWSDLPLE